MRPLLASYNATNLVLPNAEHLGNVVLRYVTTRVHFPNGNNMIFSKLRQTVPGASIIRNDSAMLVVAIMRVICLASQKEVTWIAAWRIIAFVQYAARLVGIWVIHEVCNAMGWITLDTNLKLPISPLHMSSSPQPTRVSVLLLYFSQKVTSLSFCKWWNYPTRICHGTFLVSVR